MTQTVSTVHFFGPLTNETFAIAVSVAAVHVPAVTITSGGITFARSGSTAARRSLDVTTSSSLRRSTIARRTATVTPTVIAAGTETFIADVTVTNASGSAKTNELVYFGFPMGASELPTGTTLRVYDDNGSGGQGAVLANFQLDNFASDLAGNRRWVSIAGILPNLGASATRVLQVYRTSTAVPSGTAITTANLLALAGMANGGIVVNLTIAGTTYVARLNEALAGASTFSKTAACNHGNWRAGPCMTEFILSIPMSAGGVPHNAGDGMRVEFYVKAWKASTAAVSGGNPILGLQARVVCRSGHRNVQSQFTVSTGSIQRMTSLTDATLINSNGTDQEGRTIVYNWTSSFTHWGGAEWRRWVFVGTKPTNVVMLGDATATGGTAVTPTDKQLSTRLAATSLFPKSGKTFADTSLTAYLSQFNATSESLPLQSGLTHMGNLLKNVGAGGQSAELSVINRWNIVSIARYTADARRLIFKNAEYFGTRRWSASSLNYASSTQRYFRNGDTYAGLASETVNDPWNYGDSTSHEHEISYTAYLLAGEYDDYHTLHARVATYGGFQTTSSGTGQNMTWLGDFSKGGQWGDQYAGTSQYRWAKHNEQVRSIAWALRSLGELGLLCPDRFSTPNLLSWDKTWSKTWVERHWTRFKNVIDNSTGPSSPLNRFGVSVMRYYNDFAEPTSFSPWMYGYMTSACTHLSLIGMGNSDLDSCLEWQFDWYIDQFNSSEVWIDMCLFGAHDKFVLIDDATVIRSIADWYRRLVQRNPLVNGPGSTADFRSHRWNFTGTATLSATSGAAVTVTLPQSLLSVSRAAHYIGGWFAELSGGQFTGTTGAGIITAVLAANQIRIDTTAATGRAFTTTNLTTGNWSMPPPAAPEDRPANGTAALVSSGVHVGSQVEYVDIARGTLAWGVMRGISGATAVYNYLNTYKPNVSGQGGLEYDGWDIRP